MIGDCIIWTKELFKNIGIAIKNSARENTCLHDYELLDPVTREKQGWKVKQVLRCKKCGRIKE